MSASFSAKQDLVRNKQLKVQQISLPFVITGNATPASVVLTPEDPSILFLQTQGVNQVTAALASGETAPTYTTVDANGTFGALVAIGETLVKVVDAQIVSRTGEQVCYAYLPSAPSNGITAGTGGGKKIALQCKIPASLISTGTGFDGTLLVEYVVTNGN